MPNKPDRDVCLAFAARLAAASERAGMPASRLADAMGYATTSNLSRWMGGRGLPSYEQLVLLCRALGVSSDYMLGFTEDPTPPWDLAHSAVAAYHAALTAAAVSMDGGGEWSVTNHWRAYPGDERPLCELKPTPDSPIGAALYAALSEHPTASGLHPWAIMQGENTRELEQLLESDPAITVGEARFLADGLRFLGGPHSRKRVATWYRQRLDELRDRMARD